MRSALLSGPVKHGEPGWGKATSPGAPLASTTNFPCPIFEPSSWREGGRPQSSPGRVSSANLFSNHRAAPKRCFASHIWKPDGRVLHSSYPGKGLHLVPMTNPRHETIDI